MTRTRWTILLTLILMLAGSFYLRGARKKGDEQTKQARAPMSANQQIADEILLRLAALRNDEVDTKTALAAAAPTNSVDQFLKGAELAELDFETDAKPTPAATATIAEKAQTSVPTATPIPVATERVATPTPVPATPTAEPTRSPEPTNTPVKETKAVDPGQDKLKEELLAKLDDRARDLENSERENARLAKEIQDLRTTKAERDTLRAELEKSEARIHQLEEEITRKEQRGNESLRQSTEIGKRASVLEKQLNAAIERATAEEKTSAQLRRAVQEFEKRVKVLEEQRLAQSEEKEQLLLKQLSSLRKDLAVAEGSLDELRIKSRQTAEELSQKSAALSNVKSQLEARQKQADECNVQLASSVRTNERAKGLNTEVIELKNELLLAKEQIRALSSGQAAAPARVAALPPQPQRQPVAQPVKRQQPNQQQIQDRIAQQLAQLQSRNAAQKTQPATQPEPKSDTLTVEVVVEKANLRQGPGEEHSAAMEVQRGSRLTVEAKEGDWYRVFSPVGTRAYIRGDLVTELDASMRPRAQGAPQVRTVRKDDDSISETGRAQMKSRDLLDEISEENRARGGPANETDETQAFESLKRAFETAPENSN